MSEILHIPKFCSIFADENKKYADAGLYHHLKSKYFKMRYMLDTNIVIYLATDRDSLSDDFHIILNRACSRSLIRNRIKTN